jgi:ketosteroid isomerase-like protein
MVQSRRWGRGIMAALAYLLAAGCATASPPAPVAREVRPNVIFMGAIEPAGGARARMQALIFDLASAWANCDAALMTKTLSADVDFAYPTTRVTGIDATLANLKSFCAEAEKVSLYFPADAFYIDAPTGRIAAELQFRATVKGQRQVVNDVWIATVRDGRISIIKEYLDGRVRHLQAKGELSLEEGAPFLTPWPPAVKKAP